MLVCKKQPIIFDIWHFITESAARRSFNTVIFIILNSTSGIHKHQSGQAARE